MHYLLLFKDCFIPSKVKGLPGSQMAVCRTLFEYKRTSPASPKSRDEQKVINISLFSQKKVYLISQTSDKLLYFVEKILPKLEEQNIFLFSGILEKKSKLRYFFETSNSCGIVPCYADNEKSIKKIIQERLRGFEGLTTKTINLILENSNLDRIKLNNELEKIEQFFKDKKIDYDNLESLLDLKINEDFTVLRDAALLGDKLKTNKLLSDTVIEPEKNIFYFCFNYCFYLYSI